MRRAVLALTLMVMVVSLIAVSLEADAKPSGGDNSDSAKACQKGGYANLYAIGASIPFQTEKECASWAAQGNPLATATSTHTPTVAPTNTATNTPTNTPTDTPTSIPTNTPTSTPTEAPPPTIDLQVDTFEGPNDFCDAEAGLSFFVAGENLTVELWNVGPEPDQLVASRQVIVVQDPSPSPNGYGSLFIDFGPVGSGQFQVRVQGQSVASNIVSCTVPPTSISLQVGSFNDPICDAEAGLSNFTAGEALTVELWNIAPEPDQLVASRQVTIAPDAPPSPYGYGGSFVDFGPVGTGSFVVRTVHQENLVTSEIVSCTVPPPTIDLTVRLTLENPNPNCDAEASLSGFEDGATYTIELWNVGPDPDLQIATRQLTVSPFGDQVVDFGLVGSGVFEVRTLYQDNPVTSEIIPCTVPPPAIALTVNGESCDAEASLSYFESETTYLVQLWKVGLESDQLIGTAQVTTSLFGDQSIDFGSVGSGEFQVRFEGQSVESNIASCSAPSTNTPVS